METCRTVLPVSEESEIPTVGHNAAFDPLFTDAVVTEIKKQSTAGCLLCAIDEWAEEDWE
jgi:hypothetical protein